MQTWLSCVPSVNSFCFWGFFCRLPCSRSLLDQVLWFFFFLLNQFSATDQLESGYIYRSGLSLERRGPSSSSINCSSGYQWTGGKLGAFSRVVIVAEMRLCGFGEAERQLCPLRSTRLFIIPPRCSDRPVLHSVFTGNCCWTVGVCVCVSSASDTSGGGRCGYFFPPHHFHFHILRIIIKARVCERKNTLFWLMPLIDILRAYKIGA